MRFGFALEILLSSEAQAAGLHLGIPTSGVPGLSDVQFQTPEIGWTARVPGGQARVYVGPTEADAEAWYTRALEGLTIPVASTAGGAGSAPIGDVSTGDGAGLLLFRDGNVAVMVRTDAQARSVAATLHAAIVDGPAPWPAAPSPALDAAGRWTVTVAADASVRVVGGRPVPFQPGVYQELPDQIVVWDAWGRPAVWRHD